MPKVPYCAIIISEFIIFRLVWNPKRIIAFGSVIAPVSATDQFSLLSSAKIKSVKPKKCPGISQFSNIKTHIIAKLDDAKSACKSHGEKLNYDTFLNEDFIEGDVNSLANYFSDYLDNCEKGLHIWGGESSVNLPEKAGRGGRNQQLALLMAEKIRNKDIVFLSAGTDGTAVSYTHLTLPTNREV